jgi:AraC-like DNA-binding protein
VVEASGWFGARRPAGILDGMSGRPVSKYRELAPPSELAPFVTCLWVHEVGEDAEPFVQPVLPDGAMDVVAIGGRVLVAGPATRTTLVDLGPQQLGVGVRFRPGAAPPLVGVSAAELRDQDVAVEDLWGRPGADVASRVAEAPDWEGRLEALVGGLVQRLGQARELDPVGTGVAPMLVERPERSVAELADDVGLSERQLRRRVEDAVGYPPRLLGRILRFQGFLKAARAAGPGRHLARLAADAGYADQAHLTRESRQLTGLPPAALLTWEEKRLSG